VVSDAMAAGSGTPWAQELPSGSFRRLLVCLVALSQVCWGHLAAPTLLRQMQLRRKKCPCFFGPPIEADVVTPPPGEPYYTCCHGAKPQMREKAALPTPKPIHQEGVFNLEYVGLAGSGLLGKQAFDSAAPSLCLTLSPKEDLVGGNALAFQPCEAAVKTRKSMHQVQRVDPALRQAQQFRLMPSGEIQTLGGQCVRRMPCLVGGKGARYLYDVGRCNGPGYTAKLVLEKAEVNSLERMHTLGFAEKALRALPCTNCGPYRLVEQCLARGEWSPSNTHVCGEDYQGRPGFTKQASTYIGDAAVSGRQPRINSVDTVYKRLSFQRSGKNDLAGFAPTDFDGICGSYVTDGLTMNSFFVFHRVPIENEI